jgi:uncharacterized protein
MFHLDNSGAAPPFGVRMQWGLKIPLRDGVKLQGTLYLPERPVQPSPVILTLTPYVAQMWHDFGVYFASHGFPFLCVDVRGRGNSEGEFEPNFNEAKDGYDVVEWVSRQEYCNGNVAMWGGSYAGHAQWMTAREGPAHLATIVPVAAPFIGLDSPSRNNIGEPYLMQWLLLVAGRTSQERVFWNNEHFWGQQFRRWFESGAPFQQIDTFFGNPSDIFREWLQHPHQDSYWDAYNPTPQQYSQIALPVLTITGIYDGNQLGALTHYRQHLMGAPADVRAKHFLVIGPWDHSGTRTPRTEFVGIKVGKASLIDIQQLHVQWYRWTMLDGARPEFLRDQVAYYVMEADEWRYARDLDSITERSVPLFIQSSCNPVDVFRSGLLSAERRSDRTEPDHYVYDPRDVRDAELESTVDPESRADHRMIYARVGKQLVYHSGPFETDTIIAGFFSLDVWLALDQRDTDFRAAIYEIGIDGSAILLTNDILRARYRQSHREERLVDSGEPLRYEFRRFLFVSRLIRRGRRLRLVFGPNVSIYSQRNHNSGGVVAHESMMDAEPVTVRLFHDADHPSALYVPYGRSR